MWPFNTVTKHQFRKKNKTAPLIFLPTDVQKQKWMHFHSAALKANEAIAEKLCIGPES